MSARQRQVTGGLVLSVLLLLAAIAAATSGDDGDERIGTDGGLFARAGLTTTVDQAPAVVEAATTTSGAVAAAPASAPAAAPVAPTTTLRGPVPTTVRATLTTARPAAVSTSTTAPAPLAAEAGMTTTMAPATTTTAVDPCRNSADSKCGPFRFHPRPGADNPMTVEVAVEPATPVAGEPMVFHITLTDPDGVSYNGTTFNFGNGGIGGSTPGTCAKHGPWDPPARDPASATETIAVGRTYFEPGTFTATFFFDAGPFDCTDSVTGRGDRPYASSATGTVTLTVVAS